MMIKDLEMSKDLDREALSAVRGGSFNTIQQGGIVAPVNVASGGFAFGSPTTVVSAPVNAPVATLNDNDLDLDVITKSASVIGSFGTYLWQ